MSVTPTSETKSLNGWIEVRDPYTGKLLCRIKRNRLVLEIMRRKVRTLVDLRQYERKDNEQKNRG